jgi:hypothetical protein
MFAIEMVDERDANDAAHHAWIDGLHIWSDSLSASFEDCQMQISISAMQINISREIQFHSCIIGLNPVSPIANNSLQRLANAFEQMVTTDAHLYH